MARSGTKGAAIIQHLHDKDLGKTADGRARGTDNADEPAARAVGQSVLVGDVAGEHHLAASDTINHPAETIEDRAGLPCCEFVRRVPRFNPVHEQFLILSSVCELLAMLSAHIFAARAKPHRLSLEVFLLLRREVPSIQVMLPPYFVIAFMTHHEVAQA